MLDLKYVRENLEQVTAALKKRGFDLDVERFKRVEESRRKAITEAEGLKAEKNLLSKDIGQIKKTGGDPAELLKKVAYLSEQFAKAEAKAGEWEDTLWDFLQTTPNLPDAAVPEGLTAEQNLKVRQHGEPPVFSFKPKPHWETGEALGILDFARAAKLTGARFTVYRGMGARLERALVQFMLDVQTKEHGYLEFWTPLMVNPRALFGTGQLPKFREDLFKLEGFDYFLIPTAEVTLTNLHQEEMLEEAQLPLKYTAYTPCFRSEAGSYGKDTKGMVRQHQFNKVELVKFTTPETSAQEHEKLVADAEEILKRLELPYRVMLLCAGDMGFGAAKCYDIEVYAAGTDRWWECSSCSNFTDFQARRANIRYKAKDGRKRLVHTLNGSGLATSRVLPAILENYQQEDGSVVIPKALRPYLDGMEIIKKD